MPKVSVIINCYNGEKFLAETLDSLRAQTFTDFELIFWDNCSTDKTPEIAKTFDSRLRYFRGESLIPLGQARNRALEHVTGEYVAFLDSDDLWEPEKLEREMEALTGNPDCGMAVTNYKRWNMLSGKIDIFTPNAQTHIEDFSSFVLNYGHSLSSILIRKKALEGLDHLFDNRLEYAEEYELFIRISYNWRTIYLAEPLVTYRIHSRMCTLKLRSRMAKEYEIALESLRSMVPNFDAFYPEILYHLCYLRDFSLAKFILPQGKNRQVRQLMKPYWNYTIRAKCYYLAACMPVSISKLMFRIFYRKRI